MDENDTRKDFVFTFAGGLIYWLGLGLMLSGLCAIAFGKLI